jgi:phosphoribosylformimino-5-aminoimidazole carboxamide ribotide isomerase
MLIIPAIDLQDGKCVRLTQGKFDEVTVYSDNPVAIAKQFERDGAKLIHVVDLDGAKNGNLKNINVIKKIVKSISLPIEVGGGIRDRKSARKLFSIGVLRVIVGTIALENKILLKELLDEFGEQIIVALDAKNGKLVTNGWQEESEKNVVTTAINLQNLGVQRFMYTDVLRDGMLTQPNFEEIKKLLEAVFIPIIAGGGVTKIEDVKKLNELGVEGVIVGKALYEGKINVKDLMNF